MNESTYSQQLQSAGGTGVTYHQQLAQLAGIGANVRSESTVPTITAGTETPICEITLEPGLWLILGFVKMAGGSAFQASAGISSGTASDTGNPGYTQFPVTSSSTTVATNVAKVVNVTQDTDYKMFVWCSGSNGTTRNVVGVLEAYKLK